MRIEHNNAEIQIYDFNAVQAFKIARKLEREGISFYVKFLVAAHDPVAQEVLRYLLDEEKDHLTYFENLLEGEDPDAFDDGSEDILDIIDTGVFMLPPDDELSGDLDSAIELGIAMEKRSLAFYLEVLKHTENEEGKNALRKIIGEEKKHWEELKRLIR